MFSEPGFWVMIAGAAFVAFGFLGLAFSQSGNEMPVNKADHGAKREQQAGESEVKDLPNPFSMDADSSEKTKSKRSPLP